MNRRLFLSNSLSLLGTHLWSNNIKYDPYSTKFLLGMGDLILYSNNIPLAIEPGKAFEKMQSKAKKEGVFLEIVSGYRSYARQKSIWNRKFKSNEVAGLSPKKNISKIIEYSTIPGTSRHHWGTDLDIIDGSKPKERDLLMAEKFHGKGPYSKLRKWMEQHAEKYGFYLPYTQNLNRKGFCYEPWHYSYAPLSIPLLKTYTQLDLNKLLITDGLNGGTHLTPQFISNYLEENILGIADQLKNSEFIF